MQKLLLVILSSCLLSACSQKQNSNTAHQIKVAVNDDPQTLDPRQARDFTTINIMNALYEGLMRIDSQGNPQLALSEKVDISPDLKTYTFHLRKANWSNGDPILASDFEKSWKESLDPKKPTPNAFQLYPIKGAKDYNQGKTPLEMVSVKAINPSTLVVELEKPTPYFLSLAAVHFYFPTHNVQESSFVGNGPFKLKEWSKHNEVVLEKNPNYWDKDHVHLDSLTFVIAEDNTALQLFQKGELDWAGSPSSTLPTDSLSSLRTKGDLSVTPGAGTVLLRINTTKPPFDNVELRKALRDALNRKDLVEHVLQGNQIPAFRLVPPSFGFKEELFSEKNPSLNSKNIPQITLSYASNERNNKIAQVLQEQWKKNLGIDVKLQAQETKVVFEKEKNGEYDVSLRGWFADYRDPISFLDLFKEKSNGTNNTGWENNRFKELLTQSESEADPAKREKLLREAEAILIEESPIIPLFFASYNYVKKPNVKDVYFSELGYLDFKGADKNEP